MTIQDFINKYNGRRVDFDGAYGAQCADLIEQYNKEFVGAPRIGGNALEMFARASNYHYQKLYNSVTFVPRAGDIVVFGRSYGGGYGHVGICTGQGNALWFQSLDQNYPWGSACHLVNHSYFGIVGFLRPNKLSVVIPTPKPAPSPSPAPSLFWVRVDKAQAAVRTQPKPSAPLGGSQILYRGNTFQAAGTVVGENVMGNNIWYRSAKGNFCWSGGLTRI